MKGLANWFIGWPIKAGKVFGWGNGLNGMGLPVNIRVLSAVRFRRARTR
jgi:hypothetical protein